ncbi:unnamed protein product [Rotaria sp. Silwood2]|nr:unnamed protein product [Rotaria sp. Silwood2]CAF3293040.1 unnamed protein product [Rotaria sp. Silwood2]CAF3978887.1 unnamed protein product [Rotaria sp. Silwood2]CAF4252455.1 unnamed protein product [Rotaria sp. Silwood2]
MSPLIHRSIEILMKKMSDRCARGEPFDIYAYFKRFTMDTIWSCGFGLDTDMQNNVSDPYLFNSQQVFARNKIRRIILVLTILITELRKVWRSIFQSLGIVRYWLRRYIPVTQRLINENPATWIVKQANGMIEKRQHFGHTDRTDLLQLMLDSMSEEDLIQDSPASFAKSRDSEAEVPLVRKITKSEISANIFLFMIAGYETTSTALSYITYVLATHPEEQQKLQEHIDAYFEPETEHTMPTYETVSEMDYLDMFIRETLRMFPIAPTAITRQSTDDFPIEGIGVVPAGTLITVDVYNLHYNPNLWGPLDPHEFHPERFATKRHPMAWIPFIHLLHVFLPLSRLSLNVHHHYREQWYSHPLIILLLIFFNEGALQYIIYLVGLLPSAFYIELRKPSNQRDYSVFVWLVLRSFAYVILNALLKSLSIFLSSLLYVKWRMRLVLYLHSFYFTQQRYYHLLNMTQQKQTRENDYQNHSIQTKDTDDHQQKSVDHIITTSSSPVVTSNLLIDNPDQRITQDVDSLCRSLSSIIPLLVISPFTIAYYAYRTWQITGYYGPLAITIYFLLWTAINKIFISIVSRTIFQQNTSEGSFRFLHAQIRTHNETIAFYHGDAFEHKRFDNYLLKTLVPLLYRRTWQEFLLNLSTNLYDYIGSIISYLLLALAIFVFHFYDHVSTDDLVQIISQTSFITGYLIYRFNLLNDLTEKLTVIAANTHRDSGVGKTSLFRVLHSLWPVNIHGSFSYHLANAYLLPQRPYFTNLALYDELSYPDVHTLPSGERQQQIVHLLDEWNLTHILDCVESNLFTCPKYAWQDLLSPGELQRLSFIRLLLRLSSPNDPRSSRLTLIFLDEITSSLDVNMEMKMYNYLVKQNLTLISIGHRDTLRQYHQYELKLHSNGEYILENIQS